MELNQRCSTSNSKSPEPMASLMIERYLGGSWRLQVWGCVGVGRGGENGW